MDSEPSAKPDPKPITNAQTVCNEINAKGKSCNGFLKQINTAGENAKRHLRGEDAQYHCQTCGRIYAGPPLGHMRDPAKQDRFVQKELTDLLEAAGGTMPVIVQNERGTYTLAVDAEKHAALTENPEAKS
jgi:hypothetical protein